MAGSCFRIKKWSWNNNKSGASSSSKAVEGSSVVRGREKKTAAETEQNMERKRFDSLESWSMILDSENVETWEPSKEEQMEEWTADLSQLFIGNKFASGAHSRIYRGIYKQRAVAVKMVRRMAMSRT